MNQMSEQNCSAVPPGSVLSLHSSLPLDRVSLCFQLFAGCSAQTSYLLEVLDPHLQPLQTNISLSPAYGWLADPQCIACVFLFCDGAWPRIPLSLSWFPYFQSCQLRFHQSQLPSTSSTEASSLHPRRTLNSVSLALSMCLSFGTFLSWALFSCLCLWLASLLDHTWRTVSLTNNVCFFPNIWQCLKLD